MVKKLAKNLIYAALIAASALNAGCRVNDSYPIRENNDSRNEFYDTEEDKNVKFFVEPGVDFQTTFFHGTVKDVPENIRSVPIHSDDGYAREENNGPIPKNSSRLPPLMEFRFLKSGLEIQLDGNKTLDIYGDLSFNTNQYLNCQIDENERNYTNHPGTNKRGHGAALTYWGASYGPGFIPGIKVDLNFKDEKEDTFFIGAGYRKYDIEAETGWDRHDDLERRKNFELGEIEEKSFYIGWKTNNEDLNVQLKLGINWNDYEETRDAVKIDADKISYTISFGAYYRF